MNTLCLDMYIYEILNNNIKYILLSQEVLDNDDYDIYGNQILINDKSIIGYESKLEIKNRIIIVNHVESKKKTITNHKELIEISKTYNLTKSNLLNYLFSLDDTCYRQLNFYETLILVFLLSGKCNNWPLHLLIIGRKDNGKTTLANAIYNKMDESDGIIDGGISTIKSIAPSFANRNVTYGALLTAHRLVICDEYLRVLDKVDKDDRSDKLDMINNILERNSQVIGSGLGIIKNVTMTAKFLAFSNPKPYTQSNIFELLNTYSHSSLTRYLIIYLSKEHDDYVLSEKGIVPATFKIEKKDWLAIFDYCNSFFIKSDSNKYFNEFTNKFIHDKLSELFTSRYKRHFALIVDGIVKIRCLTTFNTKFEPIKEDYIEAINIFKQILKHWIEFVPTDYQITDTLSNYEQDIINYLKLNNNECSYYMLKQKFNTHEYELARSKLLRNKVIVNDNEKQIYFINHWES